MAIEVTNITRVFNLKKGGNTIALPDPNPQFSAAEVIGFYSSQYPELTNASVTGPKIENDRAVYEFSTTVGTKG